MRAVPAACRCFMRAAHDTFQHVTGTHASSTARMCSPDMKVSAREFQKLLDFRAEDSLRDLEASCIVCYDILWYVMVHYCIL